MRAIVLSTALVAVLCLTLSAQTLSESSTPGPGSATMSASGTNSDVAEQEMSPRIYRLHRKPNQEIVDALLKTVRPTTWKYAGGEAELVWITEGNALVVRQNRLGHQQVESLLSQLKQLSSEDRKVAQTDDDPFRCRAEFEPGDKVEIEWHGSWYPGEILQFDQCRYLIHYDNYGDHWDEWVSLDRLRMPE